MKGLLIIAVLGFCLIPAAGFAADPLPVNIVVHHFEQLDNQTQPEVPKELPPYDSGNEADRENISKAVKANPEVTELILRLTNLELHNTQYQQAMVLLRASLDGCEGISEVDSIPAKERSGMFTIDMDSYSYGVSFGIKFPELATEEYPQGDRPMPTLPTHLREAFNSGAKDSEIISAITDRANTNVTSCKMKKKQEARSDAALKLIGHVEIPTFGQSSLAPSGASSTNN